MFVETIEQRQGLKIACIEEVAYRMGFIDREQLFQLGDKPGKNSYDKYILALSAPSSVLVLRYNSS